MRDHIHLDSDQVSSLARGETVEITHCGVPTEIHGSAIAFFP